MMCSRNSVNSKEGEKAAKPDQVGWISGAAVLLISLMMAVPVMSACTINEAAQTPLPADQPAAQPPVTTPDATTPSIPVTPVPAAPATPAAPAEATPAASTPIVTVTPPAKPIPTVVPPELENIVKTEACKMTITLQDMGPGWIKGNPVPPSRGEVISACTVHYYMGSSFSPVLQNTVAVYRSLSYAQRAYAKEEASHINKTHPPFGDECFMDTSVPINKLLVFRKVNVVVWIWLQNDKKGELEPYARIVEQRIIQ